MKKALITGATSQDSIYLSRFLSGKGYKVFGVVRGQDNPKIEMLRSLSSDIVIIEGDLMDHSSLLSALKQSEPDEVYNLGAISHVGYSWKNPELTAQVTGLGLTRLLESIRHFNSSIRVYQASSSELYGNCRPEEFPITEETRFRPRSPYAVAKLYAHWMAYVYRQSYDMFIACGVCFNHESPLRGLQFVTRKITYGAAEIAAGKKDNLVLGNLEAKRDWGYSRDFVEAMWLMLQQDKPDDYVICTGETHSIKELVEVAFAAAGLDDPFSYIKFSDEFKRPTEVDILLGNCSKAKRQLGWEPKTKFRELIEMMVKSDRYFISHGKINPELI